MTPNPQELRLLIALASHTRHAALDVWRIHDQQSNRTRAALATVVADICERVEETATADLEYFWNQHRAQTPGGHEE